MKKLLLVPLLAALACEPPDPEVAAWEARAERVTITRDDWGIAHVRGATDADAVFGMIYAQAEDDFDRIEVNFLNAQGRLAESEGEAEIWRDLRMKLFIDPAEIQAMYAEAPAWLVELMDAWADGLNYYLHTHPEVTPRVLTRFEPWMALTFSEGSIGGDIERISLAGLEAFYDDPPRGTGRGGDGSASAGSRVARAAETGAPAPAAADRPSSRDAWAYAEPFDGTGIAPVASVAEAGGVPDEPRGSNGFAIAPSNTANGNALLLVNPHTSFYFRSELQMTSDEGLNAYGAVTWGQFFVYQGFNETAGWMHTSSGVDNIDEYLEDVFERDGRFWYRYGEEERPVEEEEITVPYRTDAGLAERTFTVFRTHHGPIVRAAEGKWVAVKLMEEPLKALQQSYGRTKAANLDEYVETMRLHTNSSNNTVFADAEGNIAYFHSNFIPVRDARFDFTRPVDGSDPATDWQGLHTVEETPNTINPPNGWVQNTNNWPYTAAGAHSPDPDDYPVYMERGGENARGVHALMVLEGVTDFTVESLRDAAYDSYLTAFQELIPPLARSWDGLAPGHPLRARTEEQIELLRAWDLRWSVESVPTALAVFWGDELMERVRGDARAAGMSVYDYMARRATPEERLEALAAASDRLEEDFGSWRTPWGEINRFQRLTGDIDLVFDDDAPSIPVGFTSSRWGSLASFGARRYEGSRRLYGRSGNSFVAVVEFGERVRAIAVTAGGESGDPDSPHFDDQAEIYATGDLREVYFHPDQLEGRVERVYRPGER